MSFRVSTMGVKHDVNSNFMKWSLKIPLFMKKNLICHLFDLLPFAVWVFAVGKRQYHLIQPRHYRQQSDRSSLHPLNIFCGNKCEIYTCEAAILWYSKYFSSYSSISSALAAAACKCHKPSSSIPAGWHYYSLRLWPLWRGWHWPHQEFLFRD